MGYFEEFDLLELEISKFIKHSMKARGKPRRRARYVPLFNLFRFEKSITIAAPSRSLPVRPFEAKSAPAH